MKQKDDAGAARCVQATGRRRHAGGRAARKAQLGFSFLFVFFSFFTIVAGRVGAVETRGQTLPTDCFCRRLFLSSPAAMYTSTQVLRSQNALQAFLSHVNKRSPQSFSNAVRSGNINLAPALEVAGRRQNLSVRRVFVSASHVEEETSAAFS